MSKGYLYILIDPSLPKPLFKLGKTDARPRRADLTNPPDDIPYVAFDVAVTDMEKAEGVLNSQLREFADPAHEGCFRMPLDKAILRLKETAEEVDKINHFQKAIALDPENASFHNNLGCSYDKLGNHSAAINACKRAIELEPDNAVYFDNLGCNYGKLKLFRKAIEAFEEAIRLKPDFVKAYFDLGFSYTQLGSHDKAAATFQRAIAVNPNVSQVHYNMGHSLNKLGRHKEAIRVFEEAVRVNPNYVNAYFSLGMKYIDVNDRDAAMKQYKILESLDQGKGKELFNIIYKKWGRKSG